ncbi:MAG: gephyrin-like molybdotransferase Glp [bacterium]
MSDLISVENALELVLGAAKTLPPEDRPLIEARDYFLAQDISAKEAIPPFDNSAVDGFAVRIVDIEGASPSNPRTLPVGGEVRAGSSWEGELPKGKTLRILTGAPVPDGAQAVVRLEDVRESSAGVQFSREPEIGQNVRRAGGDVHPGQTVLRRGDRLTPPALGLAASLGCEEVKVTRRPQLALLVTGDELVAPGRPLAPGKIHDSNSFSLRAFFERLGYNVEFLGVASDDPQLLKSKLQQGLAADVLITSGGVSVGKYDYVRNLLKQLGAEEIFWRIAQKPARPVLFCRRGDTLIFGLPGNPVSVLVASEIYVKPALRKMEGRPDLLAPRLRLPMGEAFHKKTPLTQFVRAWAERRSERVTLRVTGPQESNVLSSSLNAHGLIVLPPETALLNEGDSVDFIVTDEEAVLRAMA